MGFRLMLVITATSQGSIMFILSVQEELPDLDEIERELKMLDEQILKMAHSNNINAEAVLASTETGLSIPNDSNGKMPN